MIHVGKNTKSTIVSKGISAGNGQNTYRGLVKILKGAKGSRNYSQCDSLLLGDRCGAHTFPYIEVRNPSSQVEHEASTSKIGEDQIFYCKQRGLSAEDAVGLIVNGFCKEVFRELPMEFAVEAQKLFGREPGRQRGLSHVRKCRRRTMGHIIVDDTMQVHLRGILEPIEIRDRQGRVIGHYTPVVSPEERAMYEKAREMMDPAELNRRLTEEKGTGRPLVEILAASEARRNRHEIHRDLQRFGAGRTCHDLEQRRGPSGDHGCR